MDRKEQALFDLLYEIKSHKTGRKSFDQKAYLAAGLWIVARSTRFADDAKEIINEIIPEFFDEEI